MKKFGFVRLVLGWAALSVGALSVAEDPHAHHRQPPPGYQRSVHAYRIPDVPLLREDGVVARSAGVLATDKALVVSFIFTSCSAICPVLTATLAQAQQRLGAEADGLRIVSVSIDPEYDTPARLRDYARQFQAQGDWHFFTGQRAAVLELQKAFDADRGGKNNHLALALIRPAGQAHWVRLEGFTSAAQLVEEIKRRQAL
jgi:protein SCO1